MALVATAETGREVGGDGFGRLCRMVHERTGLDLAPYKDKFLERRVAIRLRATSSARLSDYLDYLGREAGELDHLMQCLTIHVSTFFRNRSTYQAIREQVFPQLFVPRGSRHRKFWSVGCSRGEEPYSLAILVHEHLGEQRRQWDVQIHGIDVDDRVLEEAVRGEFAPQQLGELDAALVKKYFACDGRCRLAPEVRRMVRFHRRDILMDPPGGDYDLILCRNLLIYLGREAQGLVLERFARALRPGGFLVLGRTEIFVGSGRTAFEVVDARERIYRRLPDGEADPAARGPAPGAGNRLGGGR
jgi:chemotaxis protein methyltransferase CheR